MTDIVTASSDEMPTGQDFIDQYYDPALISEEYSPAASRPTTREAVTPMAWLLPLAVLLLALAHFAGRAAPFLVVAAAILAGVVLVLTVA